LFTPRDGTATTAALFFAALDVTLLGDRNPLRRLTSFTKAIDRILADDAKLLWIIEERTTMV